MQVDGKLPKGSIMLELRRLRLCTLQEQLRVQVEKEQADIMNMPERAYRKFARNCQSTRPGFDKLVRVSASENFRSAVVGHALVGLVRRVDRFFRPGVEL